MSNLTTAPDRPEHQLLLCCARTASPKQETCIPEIIAGDFDWNYFSLLARRHAIVSLVYKRLVQLSVEFVPPALKKEFIENSARNTVLTAELCHVVELFRAGGIEAIPYKGPVLALVAYGDLALRRFVDLDVIVKKSDVPRARDLLLSEGYELTRSLSASQQDLLLRTQHNLQFARDQRRLVFELHWEVAPHLFASSVQEDDLWRNLVTLDVNGTPMKTLTPDDLLFSLCVHGSRHLWERLGWICDIAELIARHQLDWSALLKRATDTDGERMFLLGLYLAQELLQTTLPSEVTERCAGDPRLKSLAANISAHLFSGPTHVPATSREIFKYNIGVRKSLPARARYLAYMLRPTDGDVASGSLPNFAYYLARPLRLLFKTRTT
jgi:putative nucleotidyltransferase-like protein